MRSTAARSWEHGLRADSLLDHILFQVRDRLLIEVTHVCVNEFHKAYDFLGHGLQKYHFLVLFRVLEFYLSSIFSFDKDGDLDSNCLFVFECKNPPKAVPNKFAIDPINKLALLKLLVLLKENSFDHPPFECAELEVFLTVSEIHRTTGVYNKVRVD